MNIDSIITEKKSRKKSKQVKASDKAPKLIKPNTGHESPHPLQGKMVGEMYDEPVKAINKQSHKRWLLSQFVRYADSIGFNNLKELYKDENLDKVISNMQNAGIDVLENKQVKEVFFKFASDTSTKLTEEELQLIKEAPGDIRKFLTILALMGGLVAGGKMAMDASSFKQSVLGQELKMAAEQGDEVAAYHYKNLDLYADANDQRTIVNLKLHYLEDTPRDDVKARLAKQAGKEPNYPTIQKPQGSATESTFNEAYSGTKSALVSAVMTDLEKKANDEEGVDFLRRLASLIGKKIIKRDNGSFMLENKIPFTQCPKCGGSIVHESQLNEKQDACYHKVKSRYKVWPSAYASGALVKCRKVGAKNWGNKSKKKKSKK